MWLKLFVLICGLLLGCQFEEMSMTQSSREQAHWLLKFAPQAENIEQTNWPTGQDIRYLNQVQSLRFFYPKSLWNESFQTLLQSQIIDHLETQQHPEASCVWFETASVSTKMLEVTVRVVCL